MSWSPWRQNGASAAGGNSTTPLPGGASGRVLSPVYSPYAWYVTDPTRATTDQSGNGRTTTGSGTNEQGPDLGMVAMRSARWQYNAAPVSQLRISGAVSVTALVHTNNFTGDNWFAACERTGAAWPTWWKFGIQNSAGTLRLIATWDRGQSYFQSFAPGSFTGNAWHAFTIQRRSNGLNCDGYVDGAFVGTSTHGNTANGDASALMSVGQDVFGTPNVVRNLVLAVYLGNLSAAQIAAMHRRLLGL